MNEPLIVLTTYPNNSRQLKKFITEILKSWLAKCINRFNYVKSYFLREWELQKEEEKVLLIKTNTDKKEKLEKKIKDKHPYDTPEIIYLKPEEVEEKFNKRLLE